MRRADILIGEERSRRVKVVLGQLFRAPFGTANAPRGSKSGAGSLSDWFGRRAPLLGTCALFTASGLACALASGVGALLAWRFVAGAGAGGATHP